MKRTILVWMLVLFLSLAAITWAIYRQKSNQPKILNPTVSLTITPTLSPTPTKSGNKGTLSPVPSNNSSTQPDPYRALTKPATCQIGGQIKFLSPTISEHLNADLIYTGIDSPARLIKWQVTPNDSLKVGPNLAASLKLPDGQEHIGVVLSEKPIASNYKLTAAMTYGRLVNHDVKVYEVQCQGQTEVLLNF